MYVFAQFSLGPVVSAHGQYAGRLLDEWGADVHEFVRTKLPHLIMVAIIAVVLSRILHLITTRMIRIAVQHAAGQARMAQVRTLAGVVRTTGLAILWSIVSMQFLAALGINLAPLLASAGIAGVAIGLAAQNIVKDLLNGSLILIEGQFNVGDVITVAGLTGTVENMTLRKTTVRGFDGTLYMVPNSQITTVANQSADFSVATMNISVDFSADPNKVIAILKNAAMEIRNDPSFKNLFLADPQVLGMDSMKGSQLIFPVVFKTLATQQWAPMREFQRRVRLALAEHHMLPGDPLRVFNSFDGEAHATDTPASSPKEEGAPNVPDPTTLKPQESNPFSGE